MRNCSRDHRHHTLKMLRHVIIREPEDLISLRGEPLIALTVVTKALGEIVALAIDLNNELARMSNEVGNVVADWALPPKPEGGKAMGFQVTPQQGLGTCHRPSHALGTSTLKLAHLVMWHTPLPGPPPQGGREHYHPNPGIKYAAGHRAHSVPLALATASSNKPSSTALPPRQPTTTCSAQAT